MLPVRRHYKSADRANSSDSNLLNELPAGTPSVFNLRSNGNTLAGSTMATDFIRDGSSTALTSSAGQS